MKTRSHATSVPRRPQNPSSITHRIPVEILSRIFVSHKEEAVHTSLLGAGGNGGLFESMVVPAPGLESSLIPWLATSHVCADWRSVALGCATLWNTIPLHNLEACREILRRSKQVNLHVGILNSFGGSRSKTALSRCLALALTESRRIETLDLFILSAGGSFRTRPRYLSKAFEEAEFLVLKELVVDSFNDESSWEPGNAIILAAWMGPFLQNVLGSSSSTLHSLKITLCPFIYWEKLSSSSIVRFDVLSEDLISAAAFCEVIRCLPKLQYLLFHASDALSSLEVDGAPSIETLSLPDLRAVDLSGPSVFILRMLKALPTTATSPPIQVKVNSTPDEDAFMNLTPDLNLNHILDAIFDICAPTSSSSDESPIVNSEPYRSFFLELGEDTIQLSLSRDSTIQWSDDSTAMSRTPINGSVDFAYFLPMENTPLIMGAVADKVTRAVLSKGTETAAIRLDQFVGVHTSAMLNPWLNELAIQVPTLKRLEICLTPAAQSLVLNSLDSSVEGSDQVSFPSLESLVLQNGRFERRDPASHFSMMSNLGDPYPDDYDSDMSYPATPAHSTELVSRREILYRALERRKEDGRPLPLLRIETSTGLDEDYVNVLREAKLVGILEWDGQLGVVDAFD